MRTGAIVSVGEEILAGDIVDTNAAWIAGRLRALGIALRSVRVVGDEILRIKGAIEDSAASADLVVVTGGLGPTDDDLTREGLAAALGVELQEDAAAREGLLAWFRGRGREPSRSNLRQAQVPDGAAAMPNPVGTAPGIAAPLAESVVFLLPGVPAEMRRMFDDEVIPRITSRGLVSRAPGRIKVRAIGLPESEVGERIARWMGEGRDPMVGITVSGGTITVTMTAWEMDDAALEAVAVEVESALGDAVFGRGEDRLEGRVVHDLVRTNKTLAVAESCTGGLIASLVTAIPGASEVFVEGLTTYSNGAKERRLGVRPETLAQHGAVSEAVAREMAEGLARDAGVDFALSVTGIAGPGGGSDEKPVGLVFFGVVCGTQTSVVRRIFPDDTRTEIQLRAARFGLDLVRRAIVESVAGSDR